MYYQLFNDTKKYEFDNINHLDTLNNKSNIKVLYSCYEQLSQLPQLPSNLEILYCFGNQLTQLPQLPNNLIELDCSNNQLSQLSELPNNLITLDCSDNQLTQLPQLPCNLTKLYCNNNKLTQLPELPSNLNLIKCYNNSKNLYKYIIHCKSLYIHKKYNKYRYIDILNDLLNYKIENYYYLEIIEYYDKNIIKLIYMFGY